MIRRVFAKLRSSNLLQSRVYQSLWLEMMVAATAASALMAVVSGAVVLAQGARQLERESDAVQRQLSGALTSYQPLYNLQRSLQLANSARDVEMALVVDQRGIVLAASDNALVGLPLPRLLQLPRQESLRHLFDGCPTSSTLLSCLTRDARVFHGPLPWIGGEAVLAMRSYPLALESGSRFGDRATLITVVDAHAAARESLAFTLIVFLAGLLPLMAGFTGLMLRLRRRLIPELLRLAQVDALSGVYNRRAFLESAEALLQQAERITRPMTLGLIDVDYFKQINDAHGHECGDGVIRRVPELLRSALRSGDLVGRLGGDEFVVLLQQPADQATAILERALALVRGADMAGEDGQPFRVSLSVGVAAADGPAAYSLRDLLAAADAALYVAKDRGRAQVVNLELEAQASPAQRQRGRIESWQVRGT